MLTGFLVVATLLPVQAEPAESDGLAVQVRRLVRQLDADTLILRDAAEKRLIAIGPDVLDVLPEITARTSPEVAQRLRRIVDVLQKKAAEQVTAASRVTLDEPSMPLSEFVSALRAQTGNQLVDFRGRWGQQAADVTAAARFDNVPFWQALDQFLDAAGLTLYHYTGQPRTVAYVNREEGQLPRSGRAAYCGVFRVEPTTITSTRDLQTTSSTVTKLTLEISWEPRLVPISLALPLADLKAVDELGTALVGAGREGTLESPVPNGASVVELDVPLTVPARSSQRIASLSGRMVALVPGRVESFEFTRLADADNTEVRKGGVTVVLQTVRKNVAVHEVRIVVRFEEAANALESHRGWIYTNKAYLVDADGNEVEHAGFETTRQTLNEVGMAYKFPVDKDLSKYRFVYESPAAIVQMPVEFELKDIPLP